MYSDRVIPGGKIYNQFMRDSGIKKKKSFKHI